MGEVVKEFALGAIGLEFDSRAGRIGHRRQRCATAATVLCCPGAKLRKCLLHSLHSFAKYLEYNEGLIFFCVTSTSSLSHYHLQYFTSSVTNHFTKHVAAINDARF